MSRSEKKRRIGIMGFRGVGKSSVAIQFVEKQFVDSYDPTVENTFWKDVNFNNTKYVLELRDTAGQDEYSALPNRFTAEIDGYLLVYSVTNRKSLEVLEVIWDKILDIKGLSTVPAVLVGNKSDLELERAVSSEDGRRAAEKFGGVPFFETSAKQDRGISDIFMKVLFEIEKQNGALPKSSKENSSCIIS